MAQENEPIILNSETPKVLSSTFLHGNDYYSLIGKLDDIVKLGDKGLTEKLSHLERKVNGNLKDREYGSFYGKPLPKSYNDAFKRDEFLWYDRFNTFKAKAKDFLSGFLNKESTANILMPKFTFNDKELGVFSFDRAALGLLPKYVFYSEELKKEILEDDVHTEVVDGKSFYFLKSDNSKIKLMYSIILHGGGKEYLDAGHILTQEQLDDINKRGYLEYYSSTKSAYIHKEMIVKPANAVRLFIQIGAAGSIDWQVFQYNGFLAAVIAEFFEMFGYKVSITVLMGIQRTDLNFGGTKKIGIRWVSFEAKKFNEVLYLDKFLFTVCDPTFMRIQMFRAAHIMSKYYGDDYEESIGMPTDLNQALGSVIKEFRTRDSQQLTQYYVVSLDWSGFSGAIEGDIPKDMVDKITTRALNRLMELLQNVENENRKLREKLEAEII